MKQKTHAATVTDEERAYLLGQAHNLPVLDLKNVELPPEMLRIIPGHVQRRRLLLPFALHDGVLTLIMVDPTQQGVVDDVRGMTGYDVQRVVGVRWQVEAVVNRQVAN